MSQDKTGSMGTRADQERPDYESLQQAAEWFALLKADDMDDDNRSRWQAWLAATPKHQLAWSHIERVNRQFAPLQRHGGPVMAVLKQSRTTPVNRRKLLSSSLSLLGVGILGWGSWRYSALPGALRYWQADLRTSVGEIRSLVLADGTEISLSGNTAVNIAYTTQHRQLTLLQGEILLVTAPDRRPLQVVTRDGQLAPLGTVFGVQQLEAHTTLNVYEGAVKLSNGSGSSQVAHGGQQISFSSTEISALAASAAERRSWARGLLLAEDMSLAQLVAELAPFHRQFINISPESAGLRVMGTFPLQDIDETLRMLENTLPIRIERQLHWWINIAPQ